MKYGIDKLDFTSIPKNRGVAIGVDVEYIENKELYYTYNLISFYTVLIQTYLNHFHLFFQAQEKLTSNKTCKQYNK